MSMNADLVTKFDNTVSMTFTNESYGFYPFVTTRRGPTPHFVGSIIGAEANNGKGIVGIAYGATLIGAEVYDYRGRNRRSWTVKAILHAAQRKNKGGAGADIINMVYNIRFFKDNATKFENGTQAGGKTAMQMFSKALAFANKNGVLTVAAFTGSNLTSSERRSLTLAFCDFPNVLCVASAGPSAPLCPDKPCTDANSTDPVDGFRCPGAPFNLANVTYSIATSGNYGQQVDVTAFGGRLFKNGPDPKWCVPSDAIHFLGVAWDRTNTVLLPGRTFRFGNIMAPPQVSALAALYIQKAAMDKGALETELCNPNRVKTFVNPAQIKNAILRGAVMPRGGNVKEMKLMYGAGFINVPRTLGL